MIKPPIIDRIKKWDFKTQLKIAAIAIIILITILVTILNLTITGFTTFSETNIITINTMYNESGEIPLQFNETPTSVRVNGYIVGRGDAKLILNSNINLKRIWSGTAEDKQLNDLITGLVVDLIQTSSINETANETINETFNETNTSINISVNETTNTTTNETDNETSVQEPETSIYDSSRVEEPEIIVEENFTVEFSNACDETCVLIDSNEPHSLIISLDEGISVYIESIQYTYEIDTTISQISEIPDLVVSETYELDLSEYFSGTKIYYDMQSSPGFSYSVNENMIIITPLNSGTWETLIYAFKDGQVIQSELFNITITNEEDIQAKEILNNRFDKIEFNKVIKKQKEQKTDKKQKEEVIELVIQETTDAYDIEFEDKIKSQNKAEIKGLKDINTLEEIIFAEKEKQNDKRISTDIIYVNSINITNATIQLEKQGEVNSIVMCEDFDTETKECMDWKLTTIPFIDHGTYIEFTVEHFSAYAGIIEITKAQHLDANKTFIENIYEEVKAQDNIWSKPIYHNEFIRVIFEENLTNTKDITIYARNNESSNTIVYVYEKDGTEPIIEFPIITQARYYKEYLTNLIGKQDTFDLRIVNLENNTGAYLEFDLIIDPISKTLNVTLLDTWSSSANPCSTDNAQQMARKLDGGFAYVASVADDTISILNISDPTNISCLSNTTDSVPPSSINGAQGIKLDWERNLLYVCAPTDDSFSIYNITDRNKPVALGSIATSSTPPQTADGCREVAPMNVGNQYFVAVSAITDDYLTIWNVTDPTITPEFLDSYYTNTSTVCSSDDVRTMEWDQTREILITASYTDDDIAIFSVANNDTLTCLDDYRDNAPPQSVDGPAGFEYDNETQLLYVAAAVDDTFIILNLSNTSDITYVGEVRDAIALNLIDDCTVGDVKGDQSFAYCAILDTVAGANNGLAIFNVTDPFNPELLQKLDETFITDGSGCAFNTTTYVEEHNGILYALSSGDDCFYSIKVYDYQEIENNQNTPPNYTKFSGQTTNFNSLNLSQLESVSGIILENLTHGKITWNNPINASGQNFDSYIEIGYNYIYVDSSNLDSSINSSANLTIYNVPYEVPIILRDGEVCTDCEVLNWNGVNLSFNVTGFSNYTINGSINVSLISPEDESTNTTFDYNFTANITSDYVINASLYTNESGTWEIKETRFNGEIPYNSTGLLALYHLNNESLFGETATNIYDWSGNDNNLTCTSCPTYHSNGKFGSAYDFSGTYLNGTGTNLDGKENFTVSFWVNADTSETIDTLGKVKDGNGWAFYQSGNTMVFRYRVSWSDYDTQSATSTIPVGTWTHVVGVHDGANDIDYIYINGTQSNSETSRTTDPPTSVSASFMIGGDDDWPGDFDGKIDEVAIWNRALSATEILNLYNYSKTLFEPLFQERTFSLGTYEWNVYGYNNESEYTYETNNYTFTVQEGAYAPVTQSSTILPVTAYSNDTLIGYCNVTDLNEDNITYYYTWYKNGEENTSGVTTNNYTQGTEINIANISNTLTSFGETWILSCLGSDGALNSTWMNSSENSIKETFLVELISPEDESTNTSLNYNFTANITSDYVINASLYTNESGTWEIKETRFNGEIPYNDTDLRVLYHFNNESNVEENETNIYDFAGITKNNLTCSSCPVFNESGKFGGAFNYTDHYFDATANTELTFDDKLSISIWINRDVSGDWNSFVHGTTTGDWDSSYWLSQVLGNTIRFSLGGTTTPYSDATVNLEYDTWYHVVGVYNSTHGIIYLDGEHIHNWTTTGNITSENGLRIGRESGSYPMKGRIDEVAIWNKSLSDEEVMHLYNYTKNKFYPLFQERTFSFGTYEWNVYEYNNESEYTYATNNYTFTISEDVSNVQPTITYVDSLSAQDPLEGTTKEINFSFTANDADGNNTINVSSASTIFELNGVSRTNSSCTSSELNATALNITCTINMKYYDEPGIWNINVSISDNNEEYTENITQTMTYNELSSISLNTNTIDFGTINVGEENITTTPLTINNTGNVNFSFISLKAYDLANGSDWIGVSNFTVNISNNSVGDILLNNTYINITSAKLNRSTDSEKQSEDVYIYVDVPSIALPAKVYNSIVSWIILADI